MRDRQRGTVHLGVVEGNGEPTGLVLTSTSKKSSFFVFAFVLFLCLLGPLGLFLFPLHSSSFFSFIPRFLNSSGSDVPELCFF